jgi:hypothetical protein
MRNPTQDIPSQIFKVRLSLLKIPGNPRVDSGEIDGEVTEAEP